MQFAIVDIETTGGFPEQHGMTEIAIVLHNGTEVEGRYETLINPHQPIPPYIANMTGISDKMVSEAPSFEEVAPHIFNLLKDRIFVAHNVNFDYSFVKCHLQQAGFQLNVSKLCPGKCSLGLENTDLDIYAANWIYRSPTGIVRVVMLLPQRKYWIWFYRTMACDSLRSC